MIPHSNYVRKIPDEVMTWYVFSERPNLQILQSKQIISLIDYHQNNYANNNYHSNQKYNLHYKLINLIPHLVKLPPEKLQQKALPQQPQGKRNSGFTYHSELCLCIVLDIGPVKYSSISYQKGS